MDKRRPPISSFSIILIFLCLGIIGAALIPLQSIQLYPSAEHARLDVRYSWPNASPRVLEQEVTSRLEGVFASVSGIRDISSTSSRGHGSIHLIFKDGVDRDRVRFEIASLIRRTYPELPAQVTYPQLSVSTTGDRIHPLMTYSVNGSASPLFIKQFADKHIVPPLTRIEGVGEVQLSGSTPYEMEVEFDPNVLHVLGITGDDIATAINRHFKTDLIGKGRYQLPGKKYLNELSLALRYNVSDTLAWEDIPVRKSGDRILYLRDLAQVRYKEKLPSAYYRINGLNTVNIIIYPEPGTNTIALAKSIRAEIDRTRQHLDPNFAIVLSNDSTEYLVKELDKIVFRAALSLAILLVFVFAVSRDWRYLFLIVLTVVANLLIAGIFFYFFKVELELYSLAGLTISLGIMIDNSIIMSDHLRKRGDRKAMLSIVAATLTTIAALAVIFFLPEREKANLIHFAWVIIVTLAVSILVAWLLIPALMEKIALTHRSTRKPVRQRRAVVKLTQLYAASIRRTKRWVWMPVVLLILAFGIPVQWLPDTVEGESRWSAWYNETVGSRWFREELRSPLEKTLGGALRLFSKHVFSSSYYADPGRTTLYVSGSMPEGCTVQQLNAAMEEMENFLSQFDEVELFQTSVPDYRRGQITIHFKPKHEWGNFPYVLKSALESKAIMLGGADWRVWGVGLGFSNAVHEQSHNNRIALKGYNYDRLYDYADKLRTRLLLNPRIREADIISSPWSALLAHEYSMSFNAEQMALHFVVPGTFYNSLRDNGYRRQLNPVFTGTEMREVYLTSDRHESFNAWDFDHGALELQDRLFKMSDFASIRKERTGNDIMKHNQEYQLIVAYDFIGPHELSRMVRERHLEEIEAGLPVGFTVEDVQFSGWNRENKTQYHLILLVIVIIYMICAILLESLSQPLAIVVMIPISFIGVFLTFYIFDLNFDQGGYASFILLSGLTVNAALYIVNDYNNLRKTHRTISTLHLYLKAWNYKVVPVIITIASTILGLVPFVIHGQQEVFWFAFAAGTMGGLAFSMVGILLYLPLFIKGLK